MDECDLSFVTEDGVVEFLLKSHKKSSKLDFYKTFPETHADIIFILQNLLEFNPYFRKKPEELLKLEIFTQLRADYPEFLLPPPSQV